MDIFDKASPQSWKENLQQSFRDAIRQRSAVIIQCRYPLDACNSENLLMSGRFIGLTRNLAKYIIHEFDFDESLRLADAPSCEYCFAANMSLASGEKIRMEYAGRAHIEDEELQKNNIPESLLLRVSLPNRIKPARRHDRHDSSAANIKSPGLIFLDRQPDGRSKLLNLMAHYYKLKKRARPEIVNISAGGVCLRADPSIALKFLSGEARYLFFFFSDASLTRPHVFLGRKAGIFKTEDKAQAGLRIRFLRELDWDQTGNGLVWHDIENEGSRALAEVLKSLPEPEETGSESGAEETNGDEQG